MTPSIEALLAPDRRLVPDELVELRDGVRYVRPAAVRRVRALLDCGACWPSVAVAERLVQRLEQERIR